MPRAGTKPRRSPMASAGGEIRSHAGGPASIGAGPAEPPHAAARASREAATASRMARFMGVLRTGFARSCQQAGARGNPLPGPGNGSALPRPRPDLAGRAPVGDVQIPVATTRPAAPSLPASRPVATEAPSADGTGVANAVPRAWAGCAG